MATTSDRASVFNVSQVGSETTLGVTVAAAKKFLCTQFATDPQVPVIPYRPAGFVASTTAVAQKEATQLNISGAACYSDLVYLFSSLLKTAAISTPGGATATRRWTFAPASSSADTFASYTIETGSSMGAERVSGVVVNNLTMRWTRTDANLTGAAMGQAISEQITLTGSPTDLAALPIDPKSVSVYIGAANATNNVQTVTISTAGGAATGGTFTLTFEGQTTSALAFSANAATVQAALQALSTVGSNVTVGGGPGPSSAYTVTFTGLFAGVNASLLTGSGALLTGPGSPYTVTATNTTPGGMTKLTRCLSCELVIPDRFVFPYTLNDADPSWSFVAQQGVDPRCTIVLEHDSVGSGFMTQLRARTTYYCKILARGPAVETVSSVPYPNALQIAFPFKFIENTRQDTDGVYTSTYPMALMYDTGFGGWLNVAVDNALTAL